MSTYALFIATNPEPVSDSPSASLDEVFDRARLSSGGTKVSVRSAEDGTSADDYDTHVATFVNGIQLEIRDEGPDGFAFLGDGKLLGTASRRDGGQWTLLATPAVPIPVTNPVATIAADDASRQEAEAEFSRYVEDWLA